MTDRAYADLAKQRRTRRKRPRLRRWLKRGALALLALLLAATSAGVTYKLIWSARASDALAARLAVDDPYRPLVSSMSVAPDADGSPALQAASTAATNRYWSDGYDFWSMWSDHINWDCNARFIDVLRREPALVTPEFRAALEAHVDDFADVYRDIERGLSAPAFSVGPQNPEVLTDLLQERRGLLWLDSPHAAIDDWLRLCRLTIVCDASAGDLFHEDMRIHTALLEELSLLVDGVDPTELPIDELAAMLATPTNLDYAALRAYWAAREERDEWIASYGPVTPLGALYQFAYQEREVIAVHDTYRTGIAALNNDNPRPILATLEDTFDPDVPRIHCYCCGTYAPYLYESYLRLAAATAYLHVGKLALAQLKRWRETGEFAATLPADALVDACHTPIVYTVSDRGFTFAWDAPYWSNLSPWPEPRIKQWSYTLPSGDAD